MGGKIAERLGVQLADAGLKTFADGEVYCRYQDSIRGADLFLIQSLCGSEREGLTPNDALMELLLMVHAAKHASAHRIIAVTPWYGYSRQDKKSAPREPISARLVAELLETAGIDRLVTMDLHAGQVQGFFSKPVDHMTAMPILTQYMSDVYGHEDELVMIAPDAGRVKLVRSFARQVGAPYALMEKERPAQGVAEIGTVIGDVKGKVAVIVDDIIGTGGTLAAAAQTVLDEGARSVHAVATHGLFAGNAFETLAASPLDGIVVTDTVPLPDPAPRPDHPAHLRRRADRLDPPDLQRRLGVRGLRRREPALLRDFLLTVHVLAAVIWVGGAIAMHILGRRVLNRGDNGEILAFSMEINKVALRLFAPTSLVLLLVGIGLVLDSPAYEFSQVWIGIALAGWLFSFIVGVGYYGPQDKKLQTLVAERGPDDPGVAGNVRAALNVNSVEVGILALVVIDMTLKPGL